MRTSDHRLKHPVVNCHHYGSTVPPDPLTATVPSRRPGASSAATGRYNHEIESGGRMFRPTAADERKHLFDCPRATLHSVRPHYPTRFVDPDVSNLGLEDCEFPYR
jgi:hypothetical protein